MGAFLTGFTQGMAGALQRKHDAEEQQNKQKMAFYQKVMNDTSGVFSDEDHQEAAQQMQKLLNPEARKAFKNVAPILQKVMGAARQKQQQGPVPAPGVPAGKPVTPDGDPAPMQEQAPGTQAGSQNGVRQGPARAPIGAGYSRQRMLNEQSKAETAADVRQRSMFDYQQTRREQTARTERQDTAAIAAKDREERLKALEADPNFQAMDPKQKSAARLEVGYGIKLPAGEKEQKPTGKERDDQLAVRAYNEAHRRPPDTPLQASEEIQARRAMKEAETPDKIPSALEQWREALTWSQSSDPDKATAGKQWLAAQQQRQQAVQIRIDNARQRGAEDAPDYVQRYASDYSTGKLKLSEIPMKDRNAVMRYMSQAGIETPVSLTPAAQTVLTQIDPVLNQIQAAKESLESTKGNNTPGYFFVDRVKYAMGVDTGASGLIANLSMSSILGASRILKGGASRTKAIFEEAEKHTPNVWKDSPKLVYDKLSQMEKSILEGKQALMEEGSRTGVVDRQPSRATPPPSKPGGSGIKIISVTPVQ
jgi:hypothetical protein